MVEDEDINETDFCNKRKNDDIEISNVVKI